MNVILETERDQGRMIAEAYSDHSRFDKKEIPLAGDRLTMTEAAETISEVTGKSVTAQSMTAEEFCADEDVQSAFREVFGEFAEDALAGTVQSYEWDNNDGYTADPSECSRYGVKLDKTVPNG